MEEIQALMEQKFAMPHMPEIQMPTIEFEIPQQSVWGEPPMPIFAMPEWNRPMGFNLF